MAKRKRFWFWWYHNTNWTGWRKFFLPWVGNDEYGRKVLVWPIHPGGWLLIALKYCYCDDCAAVRRQTFMAEREEADHYVSNEADGLGGYLCICGRARYSQKYGCMRGL